MDAVRQDERSLAAIGLIGDLQDPWIVGLAGILGRSRAVHPLDGARVLPDRPFDGRQGLGAVVVHRHSLTARDADAVRQWRNRWGEAAPRLVLCVSPYVRYADLERWSELFDIVVSEAVAPAVLPGRLARLVDGATRRKSETPAAKVRVEVAGGDDELSRVIVDACKAAGYAVSAIDDSEIGGLPATRPKATRGAAGSRVLTIWEVPVLEESWSARLEWRARRTGPVIVLAGFLDRALADRASAAGAVAALELPCDVDDLIDAVDRAVVETRADDWPVPPRLEPAHVLPPRRKPRNTVRLAIAPSTWPDRGPLPRIPSRGE